MDDSIVNPIISQMMHVTNLANYYMPIKQVEEIDNNTKM